MEYKIVYYYNIISSISLHYSWRTYINDEEKDFQMALHPETFSSSWVCDIITEYIVYVAELVKAMELQGTEGTSLKMGWGEWNMQHACEPRLLQQFGNPVEADMIWLVVF